MSYLEDIQAMWYYIKMKTTNTYYVKPPRYSPIWDRFSYYFATSKIIYLFMTWAAVVDIYGIINRSAWGYYLILLIFVLPALIQNFKSVWLNKPSYGYVPQRLINPDREYE